MAVYPILLKKVLLPVHNRMRNRKYLERLTLLEASQWWSADELRNFQWKELRKLLAVAFGSVPYYQKKYSGITLEDIRTWEDFARLPILTREEVNEHRDELCSHSFEGKLLPHATGGSSGAPTRFYITYESYDWRCAAKDRVYAWSGLHRGHRSAYLWGAPVGRVSRFQTAKQRLHQFVDRQLMVNTFTQTEDFWNAVYRRIVDFRPRVLVGYVTSLEEFAAFVGRRSLSVSGLQSVIAAGEPLFAETRQHIEAALCAPVFETYGCREFMSLAGECEYHNGYHINAENVLLETVRPSAEGCSRVIVTDLHNYGMPFVRYAIGDLGSLDDSACPCGRGLPRIRTLEGRVMDALRTFDGKVVPGMFFPHLLKEVAEIERFQVRQLRPDYLSISVVLSGPLSEASQRMLHHHITSVFGSAMKWKLERVSSIPPLPSGKRRVTIGLS